MSLFGKKNAQDWLEGLLGTIAIQNAANDQQQTRLRDLAVYTAVSLIVDLIAGCEVQVLEDGKPVRNANWYTFNVSANPNQSGRELISQWLLRYYYDGAALMVHLSNGLYVADSWSVEEYPIKGDVYSGISIDGYAIKRTYKADKAYMLRQPDGLELRKLVNGAFGSYSELLEASRKSYVQSSGEKYVMQMGTYPSGDPDKSRQYRSDVAKQLKAFVEASAAAYPITKDQALTRLSSAGNGTAASDYTSLRKDIYNLVAAALHLPVSLLDGTSTATEQIFDQALTTAIDPLARRMSAELTRKTYSREDIIYRGCSVSVDTTSIKHTDILDAAGEIDKLISSGYACIDEVRRLTGQPELDTDWSQTHFITKNYGTLTDGLDPLEGGE